MENKITKSATQVDILKGMLTGDSVKKRFHDILGVKAPGFISSIINLVNSSSDWKDVDANSIMMSAAQAATLDLPIDKNLGFAYIVPYSGKAQFQMGWKGFVQLAMRTSQYKTINTAPVFEGQLISENPFTGEYDFDYYAKKSDTIIGYVAYFRLLTGFEKYLYMSYEAVHKHAKTYSQTFKSDKAYVVKSSKWTTDFDAMALKTVLKLLLSKFGVLSIEMNRAIAIDQGIIENFEGTEIKYLDNQDNAVLSIDKEEERWTFLIEESQTIAELEKHKEGLPEKYLPLYDAQHAQLLKGGKV